MKSIEIFHILIEHLVIMLIIKIIIKEEVRKKDNSYLYFYKHFQTLTQKSMSQINRESGSIITNLINYCNKNNNKKTIYLKITLY